MANDRSVELPCGHVVETWAAAQGCPWCPKVTPGPSVFRSNSSSYSGNSSYVPSQVNSTTGYAAQVVVNPFSYPPPHEETVRQWLHRQVEECRLAAYA